jgi:hypothetical protein
VVRVKASRELQEIVHLKLGLDEVTTQAAKLIVRAGELLEAVGKTDYDQWKRERAEWFKDTGYSDK